VGDEARSGPLAPGHYTVTGYGGGAALSTVEVDLAGESEKHVDLVLRPGVTRTLRFVVPAGVAWQRLQWSVRRADGTPVRSGWHRADQQGAREDEVTVDVGDYTVEASLDGGRPTSAAFAVTSLAGGGGVVEVTIE